MDRLTIYRHCSGNLNCCEHQKKNAIKVKRQCLISFALYLTVYGSVRIKYVFLVFVDEDQKRRTMNNNHNDELAEMCEVFRVQQFFFACPPSFSHMSAKWWLHFVTHFHSHQTTFIILADVDVWFVQSFHGRAEGISSIRKTLEHILAWQNFRSYQTT